MNDTLKAAGRIGAELGAAKAEVERLREALRKIIERCELFINDEADMRTHSIEALMGIAEDAPSQQAEPAQCINEDSWNCKYCRNTDTCEALADKRNFGEPAPAQDEQSPEQMLSREQIENIARKVHGDCIRLPGATYQHAAEAAVMYTLERIARPAQTEQQPEQSGLASAVRAYLDAIDNGSDEYDVRRARSGVRHALAAQWTAEQ